MLSLRRRLPVVIILVGLLSTVAFASGGASSLPPGKYGTVSFSTPVHFGQRLLPAGTFVFRCMHQGEWHLMTVYKVATSDWMALGRPVATDYCRMQDLPEKVKATVARTTEGPSGSVAIKEIRIQGEEVRHIFGEVLGFDRAAYP